LNVHFNTVVPTGLILCPSYVTSLTPVFSKVEFGNETLPEQFILVTYDGHRINPVGTTVLKCTFKKRNYVLRFFVVPNDTQPILSADACTELDAIVRVRAVDKPSTLTVPIKSSSQLSSNVESYCNASTFFLRADIQYFAK
jgi:hypothetical protein